MARFLFATIPLVGHVNPALPIAEALVRAGHEVGWYAGSRFRAPIEAVGARFFPRRAAPDFDALHIHDAFPEKRRLRGRDSLKFDIKYLFLDSLPGHREDLLQLARHYPFDAVVSDSTFFGIETLREQLNFRWAALGVSCLSYHSADTAPFGSGLPPGIPPFRRIRNRLFNYVAERVIGRDVMQHYDAKLAAVGLPPSPNYLANVIVDTADLYIQPSIPSFEYPRSDLPSTVHFIGTCLPKLSPTFVPPSWWNELTTGVPVVHVTQGTLSTNFHDLVIPTLQALANEDCLVVATTGGKPLTSINLNPLPKNVRLATYIPHAHLLPQVDVMVTNGGYGGVQQALAHGVPLIVAGNTEEKPEVSARVQWSGAGVRLNTSTPRPRRICKAVNKVLATPRFRHNAQRLQAEFGHYDSSSLAVRLLEQLVGISEPHVVQPRYAVCSEIRSADEANVTAPRKPRPGPL